MASLTRKFSNISELNSTKQTWRINVRVLRYVPYPGWNNAPEPRQVDIVLADGNHDRIQATFRGKEMVRLFSSQIVEWGAYSITNFIVVQNDDRLKTCNNSLKIMFHRGTVVRPYGDANVPRRSFKFESFEDIINQCPDPTCFIDIIGILKTTSPVEMIESRGETKQKMVVQLKDHSGKEIDVFLWGSYVDQLNNFINENDHASVIVIILEFAKVNYFDGNTSVSNSYYASRMTCNLTCEAVTDFLHKLGQADAFTTRTLEEIGGGRNLNVSADFMRIPNRRNISGLSQIDEICYCAVVATITRIETQHNWFYLACKVCSSKTKEMDNGGYFCNKCNKEVNYVVPRYRVVFNVVDSSGDTTFTMFCREIVQLIGGRSAYDLRESLILAGDDDLFPVEFDHLLGKTLLFKLSVSKFNLDNIEKLNNWTVVRVTDVPDLLAAHYALLNNDEQEIDAPSETTGSISAPLTVSSEQDCRSGHDDNTDPESSGGTQVTPCKRLFLDMEDDGGLSYVDGQASAVRLKSTVRLEKEDAPSLTPAIIN